MYQTILWDNDGVLVDTEHWFYLATRRALGELNIELDLTTYLQLMARGESSWELVRAAGYSEEELESKWQQRERYYQYYLATEDIEIEGVSACLKNLSETHRMAIVTTSNRINFEHIHDRRDIVSFMELVLTREDYAHSKPDPEPYLLALDRLDADPARTLVVEDSERGLRAAVAAGLDCAIVHNDFTASHDFSGATYRLESVAKLTEFLTAPTQSSSKRP